MSAADSITCSRETKRAEERRGGPGSEADAESSISAASHWSAEAPPLATTSRLVFPDYTRQTSNYFSKMCSERDQSPLLLIPPAAARFHPRRPRYFAPKART